MPSWKDSQSQFAARRRSLQPPFAAVAGSRSSPPQLCSRSSQTQHAAVVRSRSTQPQLAAAEEEVRLVLLEVRTLKPTSPLRQSQRGEVLARRPLAISAA
eukprot:2522390-Heterocapsa_arctica.AAC.1